MWFLFIDHSATVKQNSRGAGEFRLLAVCSDQFLL